MRINYILIGLITAALFQACSTDVNTNGPDVDIPIVYCVLQPDSAFQYVRLNKTFLNANGEDARSIAKNDPARYNYSAGEVVLSLFEVDNGKDSLIANFVPVTLNNKESGEFAGPDQILYRTANAVNIRGERRIGTSGRRRLFYKLEGLNAKTGVKFSSTTSGIGSFEIAYPLDNYDMDFNPGSRSSTLFLAISSTNCGGSLEEISACLGGATSTANFEIKYTDFYADGSNKDTALMYRNFLFPLNSALRGDDFFSFLLGQIKTNSTVSYRKFTSSNVTLFIANSDFDQYLDVLNNYNPVTQIRPTYNNISGGLGLNTVRRSKTVKVNISNLSVRNMNTITANAPDYPALFNLKFRER
jgi:hypothetical protein